MRTPDPVEERIRAFLAAGPWAVAGASRDRSKFGNQVLRCYLENELRPVFPVNPHASEVEGLACHPSLSALPEPARAVSIITPPEVSLRVLEEAAGLGIRHLWLQPGAEDERLLARADELGLEPIAGGPCLLVVLARGPAR